jgi:RNA polymerase sigma-70 factor (ECF subfamily)
VAPLPLAREAATEGQMAQQDPPPPPPRKLLRLSRARQREVLEQLVVINRPLTATEVDLLRAVYPLIWRTHFNPVWNQVKRRGVGYNQLEELTCTSLAALFKSLCKHGFPADLAVHVRGITDRTLANYVRDRKRREGDGVSVPLPSSGSEKPRSSQRTVERALANRELAARLLAELSPAQRAVVDLIIFDRLTLQEVATTLDLPEGTVKSRWMKAKAALVALAEQFMTESERAGS